MNFEEQENYRPLNLKYFQMHLPIGVGFINFEEAKIASIFPLLFEY